MNIQRSFQDDASSGLYIVPTPIGNLEDITYRALRILTEASVIAAEDTRNTIRLLNHFDVKTTLVSYHEHNWKRMEAPLLERLKNGEQVALVSDAGMPAISDPGHELVKAAIKNDISVVVLPGANAALCALVGSGLPTEEFLFHGFLPRKKRDKLAELERLKTLQATLIFYESPHRLKDTIKLLSEQLGNRQIVIARELTKKFEEYIRGTAEDLLEWINKRTIKGECCLIVEGTNQLEQDEDSLWWSHLSVKDHVTNYIEQDETSSKEAIKRVAKDRNISRRTVYQAYHVEN